MLTKVSATNCAAAGLGLASFAQRYIHITSVEAVWVNPAASRLTAPCLTRMTVLGASANVEAQSTSVFWAARKRCMLAFDV